MVTCADAIAGAGEYGTSSTTYYQSLAWEVPDSLSPYSKVVAWTTGSTVVSGEQVSASATSGVEQVTPDGSYIVDSYGTTPVKVYNAEVAWDSTSVTFAAGCLNQSGVEAISNPNWVPTADAAEQRIAQIRAERVVAVQQARRDFASGERKRVEYQVRARTVTGVEVHDRINLKSGRTERTSLVCPVGMVPSGDLQTSYGFDALKDVSAYEPRISVKRSWSKRGVTVAYSSGKLKYPSVAYTVLPCGRSAR
jgi:hypothetical protein